MILPWFATGIVTSEWVDKVDTKYRLSHVPGLNNKRIEIFDEISGNYLAPILE